VKTAIRTATPVDALAVRDVHLASIEGPGPSAYDPEVVAAWAHERDPADYPIDSEDASFVVAEVASGNGKGHEENGNDGVVGFGWLAFDPGTHLVAGADAEVVAIYVHPAAARERVGSAVLDELERGARERGIETIGLWASLPAVPFYLARGYERVVEHLHEFAPGVEGKIVEMTKAVAMEAEAEG
jgi:putative acetyltransferase